MRPKGSASARRHARTTHIASREGRREELTDDAHTATERRVREEGAVRQAAEEDDAAQERREKRTRRLRNALMVALMIALLIVAVDFIVVRSPGTRDAVFRNIACLRCHVELLDQMRLADVHQPFRRELCTSCHTPHGRKYAKSWTSGDFGRWRWLQRTLDRFYLGLVWRIFSSPWVIEDAGDGSGSSAGTEKGQKSVLVASERELCWVCHARLAPQLEMAHRHDPFTEGRCTSCHNPHASRHDVLLRQDVSDLCVSCHHIGDELADVDVHPPFAERRCTDCHRPHASDWRGMLVARQRELCFGCHISVAQLAGKQVQHEPFETGECTDCHEPHSAEVTPLLVETRPELCYECHPAIPDEFARVSRHPVGVIGCEGCHLPHASDFAGVLERPQPRLCFGCHPAIEDQRDIMFQHEPFADDVCTACHVPHGSNDAPLLQRADPEICFGCHPRIRADFQLTSAHPVGERLKCTGCHEAHASLFDPLLVSTGKQLCYRCHGYIDRYYEASSHQPIVCLDCHKAHGSTYWPILRLPNPEVCLRCHPPYADRPYYHVTRPTYWDWNARRPLTCTSTCHNPHGSPNNRMLRRPYGERGHGTDNACVVCHYDIGVEY